MVKRTCSIEGCQRSHYGRGWCQMHHYRWYKHGDPLVVLERWSGHVPPVCSVDGCDTVARCRGFCASHYARNNRYGTPLGGTGRRRLLGSPAERFWAQVERREVNECWLWQSRLTKQGYGQFYPGDDRMVYAHRWSYEQNVGPIPEGLFVDHRCHNTDEDCPGGLCDHRRCVNPRHLEAVTSAENSRRSRERSNETVISLVLPTRLRPRQFAEMVASAYATAADPAGVQVVAYLDDDDPELGAYRSIDYPLPVGLIVGERCTLSECWNRAAAKAKGDILMLCADDLRFRTPGWDTIVAGSLYGLFGDGIGLVYGRDGHADERMATHPFVTRRWVDVVGRFTAPYFCADYVDLWLHDVATRVGRARYLDGVLVEHMHPAFGKGEFDRNHQERLARAATAALPALWDELEPEREAEVERLRAALVVPA